MYKVEILKNKKKRNKKKNGHTGRQSTDIIFTKRKGKKNFIHLRPNPVALCVRTAAAAAATAVRDIPPDTHWLNSRRRRDALQRDDVDDEKKTATVGVTIRADPDTTRAR